MGGSWLHSSRHSPITHCGLVAAVGLSPCWERGGPSVSIRKDKLRYISSMPTAPCDVSGNATSAFSCPSEPTSQMTMGRNKHAENNCDTCCRHWYGVPTSWWD